MTTASEGFFCKPRLSNGHVLSGSASLSQMLLLLISNNIIMICDVCRQCAMSAGLIDSAKSLQFLTICLFGSSAAVDLMSYHQPFLEYTVAVSIQYFLLSFMVALRT